MNGAVVDIVFADIGDLEISSQNKSLVARSCRPRSTSSEAARCDLVRLVLTVSGPDVSRREFAAPTAERQLHLNAGARR